MGVHPMKRAILVLAAILAVGGSALAQDETTIIRRHHSDFSNDGDFGATVRVRHGYDDNMDRHYGWDRGRHYGWREHRMESYGMARHCRTIIIRSEDMTKRIRKCS